MSQSGFFIVFEGGEGTGKSTQVRLLERYLQAQKHKTLLSWEPGGTPVGELIRKVILDPSLDSMSPRCEALLYAAARAEHVEKKILPALKKGSHVLCDRYIDASKAYQGFGRRLGFKRIEDLNSWATGGLLPDLVFLFDLDPEKGLERVIKRQDGRLDRLEKEDLSFHEDIRQAYRFIAESQPDRYEIIDSSGDIDSVHEQIKGRVKKLLS